MSTALNTVTPQEYQIREWQASTKSEVYRGDAFAMSRGSASLSMIAANFMGQAKDAIRDKACNHVNSGPGGQGQTTGLYTPPDASIISGQQISDDDHCDKLLNPPVIVKVLYESTDYVRPRSNVQSLSPESLAKRAESDRSGSTSSPAVYSPAER